MSEQAFTKLPPVGAWRLLGAYEGFEVVRFEVGKNIVLTGTSLGVEEGTPWSIHYVIEVAANWHFKHATISDHNGDQVDIQLSDTGLWTVNGEPRPELKGCLDLDLEASAVTNTLPVHRLNLAVGEGGESNAAYVRTNGLAVERLDQAYQRLADKSDKIALDYRSPRFGYHDTLIFGRDGLAADYPGIGVRVPTNASHLV